MKSSLTFGVLGLLLLVAGCGGDADKIDKFFNQLSNAYCAYLYRCCDTQELDYFKTKFTSQDTCNHETSLTFMSASYAYQFAADEGALGANSGAMDGCISAINGTACGQYKSLTTSPLTSNAVQACKSTTLFEGKRSPKEECFTPLDCKLGNYCASSGTTAGVCVPLRAVDEPCDLDSQCQDGLGCAKPKSGVYTCRPLAKSGESCAEVGCDSTTDPYLYCNSIGTTSPTCASKKADGESCKTSLECISGNCSGTGGSMKCGTGASACDGK
jgi:hypothetical protein